MMKSSELTTKTRIAPETRKSTKTQAAFTGKAPEAMARNFFSGCRASASLSIRSLKMYPLELVRQKAPKPHMASSTLSTLTNSTEKISAAMSKTFLVHCLGRRACRAAIGKRTIGEAGVSVTCSS